MMKWKIALLNLLPVLIFIGVFTACTGQPIRARSSVVDFLYPKDSGMTIEKTTPVLYLPVKVGIAFVPRQQTVSPAKNEPASSTQVSREPLVPLPFNQEPLTEAEKSSLLEDVASHFREFEFISEIKVIPSSYLKEKGGFENLDTLKLMYNIDLIALVSYDQVQFTDEDALSLTYWTLIGAYVVSGEENDTRTMLDTAVYDIASRQMLFRAPGDSAIKARSTPINLSEALRADSLQGFKDAASNMIVNLELELNKFREEIKSSPDKVKIIRKSTPSN